MTADEAVELIVGDFKQTDAGSSIEGDKEDAFRESVRIAVENLTPELAVEFYQKAKEIGETIEELKGGV